MPHKMSLADSYRLSLMIADLRDMRRKYTRYNEEDYQSYSMAISSIMKLAPTDVLVRGTD